MLIKFATNFSKKASAMNQPITVKDKQFILSISNSEIQKSIQKVADQIHKTILCKLPTTEKHGKQRPPKQ